MASSPSPAACPTTCDARPLARCAGGSGRRGGGRVRGRLAGEPDRPRRDPAGVPDQGAAGHRLPRLRQLADDLLAAPSRLPRGGALQRAGLVAVVLLVWAFAAWTYGRLAGRPVRSWQHLRWSAPIALALTLVWFVVRNLGFGPFPGAVRLKHRRCATQFGPPTRLIRWNQHPPAPSWWSTSARSTRS